jgi:uncharacterized repeat protein (TIGR01451 family)
MKILWILVLILLMFSSVASAKTEGFEMRNNTGLNFELGYYKIEIIDISKPGDLTFAKVNISSGDSSRTFYLYDSAESITKEAGLPYNKTQITASMFQVAAPASFRLNVTYPDTWSTPVKYEIATPALIEASKVPNIVLTKSVGKTNVNIGDVVEFKLTVENTGNGTASDMTLTEFLPSGFTRAAGTMFPPEIKKSLDPGQIDMIVYGLKAVEGGTFNIEPAILSYGSKTSKSNSITITVAREVKEKSNLTTAITIDKNDVMTDDLINMVVKITNNGNSSAESVLVDGLVPNGLKLEEGDLRQVYKKIESGESESYSAILKAVDGGNYTIRLKTSYNDDTTGFATSSETISVTKKEKNPVDYWYIIIPAIGVIIGVLLFTIRKHKEYRY